MNVMPDWAWFLIMVAAYVIGIFAGYHDGWGKGHVKGFADGYEYRKREAKR